MSNDLITLGAKADEVRKQFHPEGVVSYTLSIDQSAAVHIFAGSVEERLNMLHELVQHDIQVFRPLVQPSATGVEYLKTIALSRLFLQNTWHIQGSWKLFGLKVAQVSLRFGVDDLGLPEGEVTEEELRRLIRDAGFVPKQRDALFRNYAIV
jgi:hypothetical protein